MVENTQYALKGQKLLARANCTGRKYCCLNSFNSFNSLTPYFI